MESKCSWCSLTVMPRGSKCVLWHATWKEGEASGAGAGAQARPSQPPYPPTAACIGHHQPPATMTFLPYPNIPYKIVHTGDIFLLLALGFIYELVMRVYQHSNARRTPQERKLKIHLATLRYEAAKKRALGPSAFVETAKLERAVLATEKELNKLVEEREARTNRVGRLIKKCNLITNVTVILVYWGVAIVAIDGSRLYKSSNDSSDEIITDVERASEFWKGFMFPLPYNGMAYKIGQLGIESAMKPSCLGALIVVWAARVTSGEIFECALQWVAR